MFNYKTKKTCYSWSMASLGKVKPSKSPQALDSRMPGGVRPDGTGSGLSGLGDIGRQTREKTLVTFV